MVVTLLQLEPVHQRAVANRRSAELRSSRARALRQAVQSGAYAELLADSSHAARGLMVYRVVLAACGRCRADQHRRRAANRVLRLCGVPPFALLGELTDRQREVLAEALRREAKR